MNKKRIDEWTGQHDKFLAETVLNFVREGKTQTQAFDFVGEKLDRTAGACGFRWNDTLRKEYEEHLKEARREFRQKKKGQVVKTTKAVKEKVEIIEKSSIQVDGVQKIFKYSGNEVRTIVKDDEVWFVAKDVCEVLEIGDTRKAVSRLEEDERILIPVIDSLGRKQETFIVNEPGLYSLILGSRKQEAKQFKRWVIHEVLPSIRKHGAYMTDDVLQKTIDDPDYMIGLLTTLKEEKQKRVEAEMTINILTHVNKTYTATELAKELGLKSAIALNQDLQQKKIQFNQSGTWVFYSKFADKGYVDIKQEVLDNGKVIYHRKFTQLGREFLLSLYGLNKKKA